MHGPFRWGAVIAAVLLAVVVGVTSSLAANHSEVV